MSRQHAGCAFLPEDAAAARVGPAIAIQVLLSASTCQSSFWTLPANLLAGAGAAAGIALDV
jgi:hypothetical protein